MKTGKKMAAAIAAVTAYLQQEQEALALQAMDAQTAPAALTAGRPWGMSGRQNQMQLRNLMEMKAFHGWRIR